MNDKDQIEELKSQIVNLKIRVKRLEDFYKAFPDPSDYIDLAGNDGFEDGMLEEAIRMVCQEDTVSASFLQRKLSLGYSSASRLLDHLEELGVVGQAVGSKPREALVKNAEEFIQGMKKS